MASLLTTLSTGKCPYSLRFLVLLNSFFLYSLIFWEVNKGVEVHEKIDITFQILRY